MLICYDRVTWSRALIIFGMFRAQRFISIILNVCSWFLLERKIFWSIPLVGDVRLLGV
jgi:hypothetical protein